MLRHALVDGLPLSDYERRVLSRVGCWEAHSVAVLAGCWPGPARAFAPCTGPCEAVGAENRVTASDQPVQGRRTDLAATVQSPRSMISRCGLPTRVPDALPRAELAGTAHRNRCSQGRRGPGPASRSRCAAPTPPTSETEGRSPLHMRPGPPTRPVHDAQEACGDALPPTGGERVRGDVWRLPARRPVLHRPTAPLCGYRLPGDAGGGPWTHTTCTAGSCGTAGS